MKKYQGKDPAALADELGSAYTKAKAEEKKAKSQADEAATTIKSMAEQCGSQLDKKTVVIGTRFEVGYTQPDASPSLDSDKLRKMVTPSIWKQMTVEVVDQAKFVALVETGVIPKKTAEAVLLPGKPPTPRVLVQAL